MEQSGEVARWTHSPGDSESWGPEVGADGALMFTSNRDGKRELYRMDPSGEVRRVTLTPGRAESWLSAAQDQPAE